MDDTKELFFLLKKKRIKNYLKLSNILKVESIRKYISKYKTQQMYRS